MESHVGMQQVMNHHVRRLTYYIYIIISRVYTAGAKAEMPTKYIPRHQRPVFKMSVAYLMGHVNLDPTSNRNQTYQLSFSCLHSPDQDAICIFGAANITQKFISLSLSLYYVFAIDIY